ncbi:MAG: copper resistance protein CopZ [Kiritimatiellae bacterium]|nr:copper resistance protein CopZ [Kiritimatiellia bacterium]
MYRTTAQVEGMMCKMCEAHLQDAVRKAFPVRKASASHARNRLEILSEAPIDEAALRQTVEATGYQMGGFSAAVVEKKPFRLFFRS